MSKHNELGKDAEILAVNFLKKINYLILHQNYRYGHKEVDIICQDQEVIVFVEVKCRTSIRFGWPEGAVNSRKKQHLKIVAEHYLSDYVTSVPIRFDIISITPDQETGILQVVHFKDAFY